MRCITLAVLTKATITIENVGTPAEDTITDEGLEEDFLSYISDSRLKHLTRAIEQKIKTAIYFYARHRLPDIVFAPCNAGGSD